MARMNDSQRAMLDGIRRENWSITGPKCIVKVVPISYTLVPALSGYITVGRSLINKTPKQIEQALGLRVGCMDQGARIFRFTRLPMTHEYEYELTAQYPGGLAYNEAFSDPRYLPGSPRIHQWEIKEGVNIPVDTKTFLQLLPGERFPYSWLM